MKNNNQRHWFTIEELIGVLNRSLDTANEQILNVGSETPFSVQEFSVELEVYSQEKVEEGVYTLHFSFPFEDELFDKKPHTSSKISIRLKPTLVVKHESA